jgi:FdhD protein
MIFASMGMINDLAALWSRTGGAHCSAICDCYGGLVSYAEDIGRHTSIDKAVGKALLDGRDLSECFLISTGRMPAGMVAKAYRAGIPLIVSNTAPLTSGVEIARRLGMTLICFARPPRMSVYSGIDRIRGVKV